MSELRRECPAGAAEPYLIRCPEADGPGELARNIERAVHCGHTHVLVDLGCRIDAESTLLGELYQRARQLREIRGRVGVISRSPGLRRLLDVTLLSQAFSVHATRADALASFRDAPVTPLPERAH